MASYEEISKVLEPAEMSALWLWHNEAERQAAKSGEYEEARWHKERKPLFYREPDTAP